MPPRFLKAALRDFEPYVPGFQPADEAGWLKLNSNESSYPPSPHVIEAVRAAAGDSLRLYPSPLADEGREAIARACGVRPDQVRLGNGEDELIELCFKAFAGAGDRVAFTWPTYPVLEPLCGILETEPSAHPLGPQWSLPESFFADPAPLKFLVNPNSPTGTLYAREQVTEVIERSAGVVVLDEAYVDFAPSSCLQLLDGHENLVVLRTMSKSYALAGMRLGFAIAHPDLCAALDVVKDSYPVDRLAIAAAVAAAADRSWRDHIVGNVVADREWFAGEMQALDFEVTPSAANFVLARPPEGIAAIDVKAGLEARRILIRHFPKAPLEGWLRITIGTHDEMARVLKAIQEVIRA